MPNFPTNASDWQMNFSLNLETDMTDTTKQVMTLEQVRDWHLLESIMYARCQATGDMHKAMADAIDAHLSAQRDTHDALVSENSDLRAQCEYLQRKIDEQAAQREGEAVAWMTEDGRVATSYTKEHTMPKPSKDAFNIPLYAAPPIASQREGEAVAVNELLAVIHADGGHYRAEHGVEKAAKDALLKVSELLQKSAESYTAPPIPAQREGDEPLEHLTRYDHCEDAATGADSGIIPCPDGRFLKADDVGDLIVRMLARINSAEGLLRLAEPEIAADSEHLEELQIRIHRHFSGLFQTPPPPRAVTDEMVLRACKNYYGPWWKEELNGDDFRRMRDALAAALLEKGHE
jgi:hypothetical protein